MENREGEEKKEGKGYTQNERERKSILSLYHYLLRRYIIELNDDDTENMDDGFYHGIELHVGQLHLSGQNGEKAFYILAAVGHIGTERRGRLQGHIHHLQDSNIITIT